MKTRIALLLSVGCLLFCLGGLIMNHTSEAKMKALPLQQKQLETFCTECLLGSTWTFPGGSGVYNPIVDVPLGKQFIITDIMWAEVSTLYTTPKDMAIFDSSCNWPTAAWDDGTIQNLSTGIVCGPGEQWYISLQGLTTYKALLTICGYWIDL